MSPMKKKQPRTPIRSREDIPTHFASEDEERDWWDAHELSKEVMEGMRPTWDDIGDFTPLALSAADLKETGLLLRLARRHALLFKRAMRMSAVSGAKVAAEHAAVCVLTMSAALETGLNAYVTGAVQFLPDEQKRFFGLILKSSVESQPLTQKVDVARKTLPEAFHPGNYDKVQRLIAMRNALVHGAPVYDDVHGLRQPGLSVTECSAGELLDLYHAAREFLRLLRLSPTASSQPKSS
jgi:hypothetical protein